MQLAAGETQEFRKALHKGGLERVKAALEKIDARDAGATMPDDKTCILAEIEGTIGLEQFHARVRDALMAEYSRISKHAAFQ